jgi:hypothetical protein
MSAILEPRTRIVLPERPLPALEPVTQPARPRTQPRVRPQRRESTLAIVVGFSIRLALTSFVLFCVSSGVCQYLFEQARIAGNTASGRAQIAENSLAGLRREVDRLQSADRVETWAALNGFATSYLASDEKAE